MSGMILEDLSKRYVLKAGFFKQLSGKAGVVSAVDHVSFQMKEGEIVGLVGESGCGKTTLGKMLLKIEDITSGKAYIDGVDLSSVKSRKELLEFRKKVQMIFQDPYDSLDPKFTIREIVAEPLRSLRLCQSSAEIDKRVEETLRLVELTPVKLYTERYPHQLSGGQRQRVAIARALVSNPEFIIADEPVSMLDVSLRAGVLNLLQRLNRERGIGVLLITHDLATARFLCDRIVVMYLGKFVEITDPTSLVDEAVHPYTKLLISSAPDLFADISDRIQVEGEAASAVAPPRGCRFYPRCPYTRKVCTQTVPELVECAPGHFAACHQLSPNFTKSERTR